jgi:hypothetical protein
MELPGCDCVLVLRDDKKIAVDATQKTRVAGKHSLLEGTLWREYLVTKTTFFLTL